MRHSKGSISRRSLLCAGCAATAVLASPALVHVARAANLHVIRMSSDKLGSRVWFDPVGLLVQPGDTIRWVIDANVHTTTAYHPSNENHALRIPDGAAPWDSGVLSRRGAIFEVQLTIDGVYDYFCAPHEAAGMVGRIIVGEPGDGPGTRPFDYFKAESSKADWLSVPLVARKTFPSIARIMRERVIRPPRSPDR